MSACVFVCVCMREGQRERERQRENVSVCVCMCVCERERERECVCYYRYNCALYTACCYQYLWPCAMLCICSAGQSCGEVCGRHCREKPAHHCCHDGRERARKVGCIRLVHCCGSGLPVSAVCVLNGTCYMAPLA